MADPPAASPTSPLRIALVASELAPFAKTGGLADVVAALARALHRQGHDVRVVLPLYGSLREGAHGLTPVAGLQGLSLSFPGRELTYSVHSAELPDSHRPPAEGGKGGKPSAVKPGAVKPRTVKPGAGEPLAVWFLDCPALYDRDGYYTSDPDEPLRWTALCRGVLEVCQHTGWAPDVIHCNDWHAGLIPLLLDTWYAWDKLFATTRTLLSVHNIGYQGSFPAEVLDDLGLTEARDRFHREHFEEGRVSFLETGILYASWLSTVSETYAREIQTAEYGMGMEGLLAGRADHLVGIVNGVDDREWNPALDELIPESFTAADLSGKGRCRAALLERMNLAPDPTGMTIGIVSRMTAQKGFELLPDTLPVFLQRSDIRLVVLGSGEERHERYFQWLRDAYPDKVGVYLGYQNELSHWIEAGADLFLMPSRYEPCGLNQMYSLRYGTVPLVRHTGGLADTVERWDPAARTGTGFVFYDFTPDAFFQTFDHAQEVWQDSDAWATLVQNGMARDFSWKRQAKRYVELYRQILAE